MAQIFETPEALLTEQPTVKFARSSRGILNKYDVGQDVTMLVQGFTTAERGQGANRETRAMLVLENGVMLSVTEFVFSAITKGSEVTMCIREFTPAKVKDTDPEPTPIKYFEYVSHKVNTTAKKVEQGKPLEIKSETATA